MGHSSHISSPDPLHDGWLMFIADRQTGEDSHGPELWIVDAGAIGKGPVASVKMPVRMRPQVLGTRVPAADLARARAGG